MDQGSCQTVRTFVFTTAFRPAPLAKVKPPRKDLNDAETGSLSESFDFDFESVAPRELNEECLEWAFVFAVLLCWSYPLFFICSPSHFKTKDCAAVSFPAAEPNTPSICAADPSWASTSHHCFPTWTSSEFLGSPPRNSESQWAHTL